jgi:hypothetical protein
MPNPDVNTFVSEFDLNAFSQNDFIQRLSGLFIAPVTTNYVFYLTSDDDASLFLSTNDRAENKRRIGPARVRRTEYLGRKTALISFR